MKLAGLHHITLLCRDMERTVDFYTRALGLRLIKQTVNFDDPGTKHFYFGDDSGTPGTIVTFFEYPRGMAGQVGVGTMHHFAFCVDSDAEQLAWRQRLIQLEINVTPVMDRKYFHSIYFRDPDGIILEIATRPPGFLIDEDLEHLGTQMQIPPDVEAMLR